MENNYYMLNMQKLLHLAIELHQKGFSALEVLPYLSPSGIYWRCDFISSKSGERFLVSNWLQEHFDINEKEINLSDIIRLFEEEHGNFISTCQGQYNAYTQWFSDLVLQLDISELPYAFSDYYDDPNYWQTSNGRKIKTFN